MKYVLPFSCMFLLFAGCKKLSKEKTEYDYTFVNPTDKELYVDIYPSAQDYDENTNRVANLKIMPDAEGTTKLTALKDYYIDWYSDGYTYNSWWRTISTKERIYAAPKINDKLTISEEIYGDTSRSIILNNSTSSIWKSDREYSQSGLEIGVAPYMEITLKKDHTATIKEKDSGGNITQKVVRYGITLYNSLSPAFIISLLNSANSSPFAQIHFNTYYVTSFPVNRDVLIFSPITPANVYYTFIRQ